LFELIHGTGPSPVGRELAELWPPQERPEVRDRLSEALAGLSGGRSLRSRISPDGPEIWIEASMHPVRFQAGPAVLVTVRNVTQQVRRELEIEEEVQRLKNENVKLRSSVRDRYRLGEIIGKSPAMQEVYELVLRAAGTDAHVIVSGESGTGKDLVARAIHNLSDRKNADFVPVNCGAIPENLLESEFFGYKKGAFTGASYDKHGYLDLADGGTLFLDEIGELSLNLQVKLLRAVEGGGYTPLGGRDVRKPDVRVIAASNRDLAEEVRAGRMREDFYYRIHVIPINLPPLRKRKEDLPLLIERFLDQIGDEAAAPPAAVIERLHQYHWPGNVRELQNVLQRYLALGALDFLDRPEGPRTPPADESQITVDPAGRRPLKTAVEDFERSYIRAVLERCRWNRTRAAESLGVSRRTLHRRLRDLGID
jgi:transcriptional regulator with PAS, ATPase and Fis domain